MGNTDRLDNGILAHNQLVRLAAFGLCTAEIIHELFTPLTIMLGRLAFLQQLPAPPLDDAARESVTRLSERPRA